MSKHKKGDLRVWWIPQIPMKHFHVDVESVKDGVLLLTTLENYDKFQFKNKIKPAYCNAGGLLMWDDELESDDKKDKWCDWSLTDEETGEFFDDPKDYIHWIESDKRSRD